MDIKENELQALLQEMETELQKAYDMEKDKLSKAIPDKEPEGSPDASASAPSASPSPEASDSPAPSPSPEAPAASPSPSPEAPPAGSPDPAAQEPGQAPLTPEALQAEYSQLSPEELDMHIQAALSAKEALSAAAGPAAGSPAAPPMAPPSPSPEAPPAMKAELKVDKDAIGGKIEAAKKSEPDPKVLELEALVKSQSEDIEILTKSIKMVLEQPLRKAVTTVAFVPKVEPEAKPVNITDAKKLIGDNVHKLNKAERSLVLDYFDGKVSASKLEPILEKIQK